MAEEDERPVVEGSAHGRGGERALAQARLTRHQDDLSAAVVGHSFVDLRHDASSSVSTDDPDGGLGRGPIG